MAFRASYYVWMHESVAARIRAILRAQERSEAWLSRQVGISANYLHRIMLDPNHPAARPVPPWFYERVARALGVPEEMLVEVEAAAA